MEAAQGRMDSSIHGLHAWANARLQSDSSRPGRPKSQTRPNRVDTENLAWNSSLPPRVPRDRASIELEDIVWPGRARAQFLVPAPAAVDCFIIVDCYLGMLGTVRQTTSRQPLPSTLSINLLGILPPHYPRQTAGRPRSRTRGHNLPRAMHEPADLDSVELELVAPMW